MLNLLRKKPFTQPVKLFEPKQYPHTPDIVRLERYDYQLLFLPDELSPGMAGHHRLGEDGAKITWAYSRDKFTMYKHDREIEKDGNLVTETIGIPLPDERTHSEMKKVQLPGDRGFVAKVRGQICLVRPSTIVSLDIYRENLVQFNRQRVYVCVPYVEEGTNAKGEHFVTGEKVYILRAWMYVGSRDYWDKHVDAGFRFRKAGIFSSKRRWLKEYYDFTYKGYHI